MRPQGLHLAPARGRTPGCKPKQQVASATSKLGTQTGAPLQSDTGASVAGGTAGPRRSCPFPLKGACLPLVEAQRALSLSPRPGSVSLSCAGLCTYPQLTPRYGRSEAKSYSLSQPTPSGPKSGGPRGSPAPSAHLPSFSPAGPTAPLSAHRTGPSGLSGVSLHPLHWGTHTDAMTCSRPRALRAPPLPPPTALPPGPSPGPGLQLKSSRGLCLGAGLS